MRASTSPASSFRPCSDVTICRNLASIDSVQLSSLDENISDDSEEVDKLRSSLLVRLKPPESFKFLERVRLGTVGSAAAADALPPYDAAPYGEINRRVFLQF